MSEPSLDLFVETVRLFEKVGEIAAMADILREATIIDSPHVDDRQAHLIDSLRSHATACLDLATALEENRVGISIEEPEQDPEGLPS